MQARTFEMQLGGRTLTVETEEKLYSVGKIPGGFIKREGRPSEKAILTSRLIDRPIRPLFPKGFYNDVQVIATVLSVEQDVQPEILGMIGSSIALSISDAPFMGPTGSVAVGMIDGKYILNPTLAEREQSFDVFRRRFAQSFRHERRNNDGRSGRKGSHRGRDARRDSFCT